MTAAQAPWRRPIVALWLEHLAAGLEPEAALARLVAVLGRVSHLLVASWSPEGVEDAAFGFATGSLPADAVDRLHELDVQLLLSAGGDQLTPISRWPKRGAEFGARAARWALRHGFDGVDLAIEDDEAFNRHPRLVVDWMVAATRAVREVFPLATLCHSPQAAYFSPCCGRAPYRAIDRLVGAAIDFYNVQYFSHGTTTYDSFESLFLSSTGWAAGTAVEQLASAGVDCHKIVVGRPVGGRDIVGDAMTSQRLAEFLARARRQGPRPGGAAGWQLHSGRDTRSWSCVVWEALVDRRESAGLVNEPAPRGYDFGALKEDRVKSALARQLRSRRGERRSDPLPKDLLS